MVVALLLTESYRGSGKLTTHNPSVNDPLRPARTCGGIASGKTGCYS